jgi:hypothetical protein
MADFLAIKRQRLSWATREGIIPREADGSYRPEIVVGQWLKYERGRSAKGKHRSELEQERVRLTRAKADAAVRRLAILDHGLVGTADIIELVKTVSLRIRNKLTAALPRISRACYAAPSEKESMAAARREFDVLLAELSALKNAGARGIEVVRGDESVERSSAG